MGDGVRKVLRGRFLTTRAHDQRNLALALRVWATETEVSKEDRELAEKLVVRLLDLAETLDATEELDPATKVVATQSAEEDDSLVTATSMRRFEDLLTTMSNHLEWGINSLLAESPAHESLVVVQRCLQELRFWSLRRTSRSRVSSRFENLLEYRKRIRVLVVAEEPSLRQMLRVTLQRACYQVDAVSLISEASSRVRATPPDILVGDVSRHSVLAFTHSLTSLGHGFEILVLAGDQSAASEVREAGADALTKPFASGDLLSVVDEIAQRIVREEAPDLS